MSRSAHVLTNTAHRVGPCRGDVRHWPGLHRLRLWAAGDRAAIEGDAPPCPTHPQPARDARDRRQSERSIAPAGLFARGCLTPDQQRLRGWRIVVKYTSLACDADEHVAEDRSGFLQPGV